MGSQSSLLGVLRLVRSRPLQAGKLAGVSLTLVLGFAGFFRLVSADAFVDHPTLADGQFLAVVLVPLVSLLLVCVVVCETLFAGYRILRADDSVRERFTARPGYAALRGVEAAVAVVGFGLIVLALPVLFSESTPAPAGAGLMLGLAVVGIGILVASLVRAVLELVYHANAARSG